RPALPAVLGDHMVETRPRGGFEQPELGRDRQERQRRPLGGRGTPQGDVVHHRRGADGRDLVRILGAEGEGAAGGEHERGRGWRGAAWGFPPTGWTRVWDLTSYHVAPPWARQYGRPTSLLPVGKDAVDPDRLEHDLGLVERVIDRQRRAAWEADAGCPEAALD